MSIIKNKKFILCFCAFALFCFNVLAVNLCLAQSSLLQSSDKGKYSGKCISDGDCQLNDFIVIAVRASEIILGIVGSLALLMFVYGGVMFLISAGSSERITQAKQIIVGAVIGLVIVFTAYTVIAFAAKALGIEKGILQSGWF